ncbi:S-methyl-5-thioribose-1-phosphate isomerase [Thermodesulfobacteriota bacterium]
MAKRNIKAISWEKDHISILDQTKLPGREVYLECKDLSAVAGAIKRLSIRGAPAIGVAAAMGLAFACQEVDAPDRDGFIRQMEKLSARLFKTRPTAVNLKWALGRMRDRAAQEQTSSVKTLKHILKQEALRICKEDTEINRMIGEKGQEVVPRKATIVTICNTGSLATAGHGTALGVIRTAVEHGKDIFVAACETRPLLQGARLTAWELQHDRIPFVLITDSMAGNFMLQRGADLVIAGADRVAANGDSANKIGTYSLAILAREHKIPFYIAAPVSTIDSTITSGSDIPIEERNPEEITSIGGKQITPDGISVWNPAFDVVPNHYIDGIITEKGVLRKPFDRNIRALFRSMQ